MEQAISKLTIKGYKSIRNLENFELRNINILIGPNGAGKSNFVSFFQLLTEIFKEKGMLDSYVKRIGGADKLFFLGTKITHEIEVDLDISNVIESYRFTLSATSDYKLSYQNVGVYLDNSSDEEIKRKSDSISKQLKHCVVYHFCDTSDFAGVKRPNSEGNYDYLFPDASNLAPFLLRIKEKHPRDYQAIIDVIRLAAPFFDNFKFDINEHGDVKWWWKQKENDYKFHPSQISDGTLRFICLATVLLQPDPPSTILLDEPELGLHPYALTLLAGLIQKASYRTQIIVSTQSAALIDHFQPEDIILVERKNEESVFRRLPLEKLKQWIDDYSLGELWEMNLLEGRPENE